MLISKFDLYKTEWLDLVFAKRNKEYGAYYIRQHYAGNIIKAMGITFVSIVTAAIIAGMLIRVKAEIPIVIHDVVLETYHPPVTPPKAEPKKVQPAASKPQPPAITIKFVPMVPTSKPITEEPPKLVDLQNAAVGPEEVKVAGTGPGIIDHDAGKGKDDGPAPADNSVHAPNGLDVMPAPYDGAEGWAKFLRKNLRYPAEALDRNMSGRVLVSFVIEKDGHLSSIMVDRGAGFGMDEEAMRVLKLSKAWKPGMQNGQPVRVKYIIPISFSLGQ